MLGFGGLLLRAALGDTLDTVFVVVVPAALLYAASVDLGLLRVPHAHVGAPDAGLLAVLDGPLPGDLRLGLRPRARGHDADPVPVDARRARSPRSSAGDLATAVAITTVYGAARALAVVAAVESVPGDDYAAACDAIQERVVPLKRLVGATALVIAALIVIS